MVAMNTHGELDGGAVNSTARRRRERRLRAWHRHERWTVAMEVAARFHHSVGDSEQLVVKRDLDAAIKAILGKIAVGCAAPCGQRTLFVLVEMSPVSKPVKLLVGLSPVPSSSSASCGS